MALTDTATVDGVACDVLDSLGRLVITPHALSIEGQTNVPADLQPGESLEAFLERHVPGIGSGAWSVSLGGRLVPQSMWARTYPKHGHLIACRCMVRKSVLSLIAMAALVYFSGGIAAGVYAAAGGTFVAASAGLALSAIQFGVVMAGSMLINKVLGPKVPKPADNGPGRSVYSLSGQRNSIRAYEPLPVLWGEMRVTPDLASMPYTWHEGDDQYLSIILLGGINVHSATDWSVGDTPLSTYEGVEVYPNGFSGMVSVPVPLYSNADTIAGAELVKEGPWVTRTSSAGTVALQVDIEGQLFDVDSKGGYHPNPVPVFIETRPVGGSWSAQVTGTLDNASAELMRRTFTVNVPLGQYEVRVRLGKPRWDEGEGKDVCKLSWTILKSIQPDATDYSQWGRTGIKIKATGQLSGSLDTLRGHHIAKPMPIWNGTAWVTATSRANGLSNPGAILLQTLRGVYAGGVLQFGFGMQDEQIDIEGLKAFMLHCTAKGYTYDRWITSSMSLQAFCDEVALAGMGQFVWTDGGRPTVAFVGSGQPIGGVVNMANMLKGSFSVAYNLANAADGIEYQYLDRDRNWETQTLRVMAPGVTTMLSPARITGEGVTSEAQAAVLARYHLAQSLYQYKTIDFAADIEHLDYRRLSVLSVSHDLTQWGFGGRVVSAETLAGKVVLTLDEEVPTLPTRYVGLRVPGARDYRVFGVEAFAGKSNTITLVGAWPAGVAFPGAAPDNPAHDTLWCYDFKATPGYRVRVVGIEPQADLKGANVSCVPEGPEFWDYVLNGTYVPAPNQSSLPALGRPTVSNLRISEEVHIQGDTEWYELHALWDVEGDYDHAQVWAGRDGSELRLVDGNAVSARTSFRIDSAGEWLIEVRPFSAGGLVGQGASVLYITSKTDIPPRNVDQFVVQTVEGGLRRFAWQYTGDKPPALAGVQIRYLPGDVPLSEAGWDAMLPLGKPDDIYSAQFESTRPAAGTWTFGIRAINTSGLLSPGVLRFAISLPASLPAAQAPDLTPPPAPTGVTATAAMSTAQVNWDAPTYTQGRGHSHSIISAAVVVTGQPVPVFSEAVKVGAPEGQPASIPVELGGVKYRLWVQHVSKEGVASLPSDPVEITTSVDPGKLLDVLAGSIGSAQLAPGINAELNKIDPLSVQVGGLQTQIADITGAAAYDPAKSYAANAVTKSGGKLYRAKIAVPIGAAPPDAAYWELIGEYESLGAAVSAHSLQLGSLQLEVDDLGNVVGASASAVDALVAEARDNDDDALLSGVLGQWQNRAAIVEERLVRATDDQAEAIARLELRAEVQDRLGGKADASAVNELETKVTAQDGTLTSQGSALTSLTNTVNHATTGLAATATTANNAFALAQTVDGNATSQAGTINSVVAMVSGLGRQDEDSLLAGVLGQWQNRAAIIETRDVTADALGHVSAKYSLAVDLQSNGQSVVGGMQITGSSSADAGPVVDVAFVSNTFSVVSPDATLKTVPFYVQTGPTTINGVPVPAGVYMDSAYIGNVTALFGRFGTLVSDSIQATAISASQLTLGDGTVGGVLKSSNYVAGSSGWVFNPNGAAELSGVIVRGTIYATAGSIGGITLNASGLSAGAFAGYGWPSGTGTGFHLGPQGLLLGNPSTGKYVELGANGRFAIPGLVADGGNTTFSGALSGATGTFSGALSAATGTFNGAVNASSFSTVGGRFTADSSGYVIADRIDVRRRDAMVTGSGYFGHMVFDDNGGPILAGLDIDTGVDSWDAVDFSINQPLHLILKFTTGQIWFNSGLPAEPGVVYQVYCNAQVSVGMSHFRSESTSYSAAAPRIRAAVAIRMLNVHPLINRIKLNNYSWSLFKT